MTDFDLPAISAGVPEKRTRSNRKIGIFAKYDYIAKYPTRPCYPPNCGAVDLKRAVYRGGAPTRSGIDAERILKWLKRKGVRTAALMCRSEQNTSIESEIELLRRLGMSHEYFDFATMAEEKLAGNEPTWRRFRELVDAGGVYIHCIWGADRTGGVVGRLRTDVYGWPLEDAAIELCVYGFSGRHERATLPEGYFPVLDYFGYPLSCYEPIRESDPYFALMCI